MWDLIILAICLALLVMFGGFILQIAMMLFFGIIAGIGVLFEWIVGLFNKDN